MFGRLAIVFFLASFVLICIAVIDIYIGFVALALFLLAICCAIYNQWYEIAEEAEEDEDNYYIAPGRGDV